MDQNRLNQIIKEPALLDDSHNFLFMSSTPKNVQQIFYQLILSILLIRQKRQWPDQNHLELLLSRSSSLYSKCMLKHSLTRLALQLAIEPKNIQDLPVHHLVFKWQGRLQDLGQKDPFRLINTVASDIKYKEFQHYEQCIDYLDLISVPGLLSLLVISAPKKQKIQKQNQKQEPIGSQFQHFISSSKLRPNVDIADLLAFLMGVLPKIYFNVIVPKSFFPEYDFFKLNYSQYDRVTILYTNKSLQILIRNSKNYTKLVQTAIASLINANVQYRFQKNLVLMTFHYYYLFHDEPSLFAEQFIIQCFKKISNAVRFAILDEMILFVSVLIKLSKQEFLERVSKQFQSWFQKDVYRKAKEVILVGHLHDQLYPFPTAALQMTPIIKIAPGSSTRQYFQVFHSYSLLYLKIKPAKDDITFKLLYLGGFDAPKKGSQSKTILEKEKLNHEYYEFFQFVKPGIYAFQLDNSYSWVKEKLCLLDYVILTSMQIVEDKKIVLKKDPWMNVVFAGMQKSTSLEDQAIIRRIVQNEDKKNLAQKLSKMSVKKGDHPPKQLFKLTVSYKTRQKSLSLYIIERQKGMPGKTYQYQTKDYQFFKAKLNSLKFDLVNQMWSFGVKVSSFQQLLQQFENWKTKPITAKRNEDSQQDKYEQIESQEECNEMQQND